MDLSTVETLSFESAVDHASSLLPQELDLFAETERLTLEKIAMEEPAAMPPLASSFLPLLSAEELLEAAMLLNTALETAMPAQMINSWTPTLLVENSLDFAMLHSRRPAQEMDLNATDPQSSHLSPLNLLDPFNGPTSTSFLSILTLAMEEILKEDSLSEKLPL